MAQKRLSVFIDESGDFGCYDPHCPFYFVAMVMHNQDVDIQSQLFKLNEQVGLLGFEKHAIHAGPLIRRETDYKYASRNERKKIFNILCHFIRQVEMNYLVFSIDKYPDMNRLDMHIRLTRTIVQGLKEKADFFAQFDEMVVYYDNGQNDLTNILASVFTALFSHVEFRKVVPKDYVLFQVADLICTLELVARKFEANHPSKSERDFFETYGAFRKNYLKGIRRKSL